MAKNTALSHRQQRDITTREGIQHNLLWNNVQVFSDVNFKDFGHK